MNQKKYVTPFTCPIDEFPDYPECPEGVKTLTLKDTFGPEVDFKTDIVYAIRDGEDLHIHLLQPVEGGPSALQRAYPCVVFVQGSAWHRQYLFGHLPEMVRLCQHGYTVAIVQYRPSEVAPFPAQAQDVKTAIRYLRKHAVELRLLPQRLAIWGDSSGAHTALMVAFTGDQAPDTDLYNEESAQVSCVVEWYGPVDISKMNEVPSVQDHVQPDSPEGYLIGRKNVLENPQLAEKTIPMRYLSRDKASPPLLMMHGSRDELVSFQQGCLLYQEMRALDKDVEMYRLEGAYHGYGGFHSDEALNIVIEFIRRHIG